MSTCTFLAILHAVLAIGASGAPPQPIANRRKVPAKPPQLITVRKFRRLYWSPMSRHITSQGSVEIDAHAAPPGADTVVTGENIDYDTTERSVKVYGSARVTREQDVLTGHNISYDFDTGAGELRDASAVTEFFRMRGERVQTLPDGRYVLINGIFTSCDRGRPDYVIHARHLTVSPQHYVYGRNVTFYAGTKSLITLPFIRMNLQQNSVMPVPLPSYSVSEGPVVRLYNTPVSRPHETLDYDLRVNFRSLPFGFTAYQRDITRQATTALPPRGLLQTINNPLRGFLEQIAPPTFLDYALNRYDELQTPRVTFYAIATNQEGVFNRRRDDLSVTTTPEIGLQFQNILARHRARTDATAAPGETTATGSTESALRRTPSAPLLVNIITSAGFFHENPTDVDSGRLATRLNVASQPITLGKRLSWRAGISNQLNYYTRGTAYDLVMPEAELDYVPTQTSLFGIAYRYLSDAGATPFIFDRRDLRHELRLRYQVGGPWAFGIVERYDLGIGRSYDTEVAVVRNFDCMQVGLAYRSLEQSINVIFNLLPARREKVRRPALDTLSRSPFSSFPNAQ